MTFGHRKIEEAFTMKRKYVQAMLAGMTAMISLTVAVDSVYASTVDKAVSYTHLTLPTTP